MRWAEDVPALQAIKPGGKEHPIDRIIHDSESVKLCGTILIAHLTPGHTNGCTTWTMKAKDGQKSYNVVFHCSLRAPAVLTPAVVEQFNRSFKVVRSLSCDVPLGDHPAQNNMQEKFGKLQPRGSNPFLDRAGCNVETEVEEAMFHAILKKQAQAPR